MASSIHKLKKLSSKEGINKSQPNLFKSKQNSVQDIEPFRGNPQSNIKSLAKLFRRKSKASASSDTRDRTRRPSSSLINYKKTIEDYNTTHTSTCSRQPLPSSLNLHKSTGVLISSLNDPYQMPCLTLIDKSFCKTYERFTQLHIDSVNRLSTLRKRIEDSELSQIRSIPSINRKSKELCKSTEDFFARMKKNEESALRKKEKMIKVKKKKEFEECSYQRKAKPNSSVDFDVNDRIRKLLEWDSNRKRKLEQMKEKSLVNEQRHCLQGPNLCISNKKKRHSITIINRLYKEDPMRIKEKKTLLIKALTPSFEPKINTSRNSKFNFNGDKPKEIQLDYLSAHTEHMFRKRIIMNKQKKGADIS